MENTGKVLFGGSGGSESDSGDTHPQWFIALGDRWVGPLSAADVYDKVLSQEITWAHYVWRAGQTDWKRICDTPTFQAAVPVQPPSKIQSEVLKASAPAAQAKTAAKAPPMPPAPEAESRIWFLYYNDSQFGPFNEEEIRRFLKVGKIHGRVHAWKDGMAGWQRLEKLPGFEDEIAESVRARESRAQAASPKLAQAGLSAKMASGAPSAAETAKPHANEAPARTAAPAHAAAPQVSQATAQADDRRVDQRKSPRRPLLARIVFASTKSEEVTVGVCRDVSVGGMQVLTDRIPGQPGAHIRLNVSPAGERNVRPFVAAGVIVRLLEDGRGFSFRFDSLPEESRRIIEDYIRSEE